MVGYLLLMVLVMYLLASGMFWVFSWLFSGARAFELALVSWITAAVIVALIDLKFTRPL